MKCVCNVRGFGKYELDMAKLVETIKEDVTIVIDGRQYGKMSRHDALMKLQEDICKSGGIPNEKLR